MKQGPNTSIVPDTRQKALDCGVLLDISETARACGFLIPVAISSHLVSSYILPLPGIREESRFARERLKTILVLALNAAQSVFGTGEDRVVFPCQFVVGHGRAENVDILLYMEKDTQGQSVATLVQYIDGTAVLGFTSQQ